MFGRLVIVLVAMALLLPASAGAQFQIESGSGYYFEPNSYDCGDFTPANVELKQRTRGDRYQVRLTFEITEEQFAAAECAGTHFNLQIQFSGFDEFDDWSGCSVTSLHEYIFGTDIVGWGDGTATATIYGARLTDDQLSPGDKFSVTVDCSELWPGGEDVPAVSVIYVGTWWSIEVDDPSCEPTDFVTRGLNGPAGLPVCVYYSGQTAQLLNSNWDSEFPFESN